VQKKKEKKVKKGKKSKEDVATLSVGVEGLSSQVCVCV
jgi:hypothetical protein